MKIAWEPQPRQKVFMSRPEYEVLYGGAAGAERATLYYAKRYGKCIYRIIKV